MPSYKVVFVRLLYNYYQVDFKTNRMPSATKSRKYKYITLIVISAGKCICRTFCLDNCGSVELIGHLLLESSTQVRL